MPRIAIIALLVAFGAPAAAGAQSIRVEPDPCPIPADIAPLVSEDVGTYELNPWADRLDDVLLFRDMPVGNGAFTLRLFADAATGDIYGFPTEPADCAEDLNWPE